MPQSQNALSVELSAGLSSPYGTVKDQHVVSLHWKNGAPEADSGVAQDKEHERVRAHVYQAILARYPSESRNCGNGAEF
jgi:hypothetical protein